ncbi:MAG: sigma-70 family RNA polymerase sigma factor [Actinobacteria bacterium]|nr:sigma-70 family RNA polymerase sigma factor [Actinomycetota bacterium]MBI3685989.1 sigma-70 family RNA polymerase sigma factor [Actinomycetota bacterium]
MSAYGAGHPVGVSVRAHGRAVDTIWMRPWTIIRLFSQARRSDTRGPLVVAAQPAPQQAHPLPHPPRPADDLTAHQPTYPAAREGGTGRSTGLRTAPYPAPRPAEGDTDHWTDPPEPAEPGSSWHLVERAQQGDAEAFGHLYDRYVDLVHRYIYYRVADRGTAEDFTSETFLRAWRRIGSVTNQGRDIGAWLVTIARNIVLDHVKSSRYKLEVSTADMLDADTAEDGPEGLVLDRITHAELLKCVKKLNPEQQECVVLRFLEGLSVAETAAVMGKNEGAIKALQHRAVRRLATLLPAGLR